jgi:hypothetical protein
MCLGVDKTRRNARLSKTPIALSFKPCLCSTPCMSRTWFVRVAAQIECKVHVGYVQDLNSDGEWIDFSELISKQGRRFYACRADFRGSGVVSIVRQVPNCLLPLKSSQSSTASLRYFHKSAPRKGSESGSWGLKSRLQVHMPYTHES